MKEKANRSVSEFFSLEFQEEDTEDETQNEDGEPDKNYAFLQGDSKL